MACIRARSAAAPCATAKCARPAFASVVQARRSPTARIVCQAAPAAAVAAPPALMPSVAAPPAAAPPKLHLTPGKVHNLGAEEVQTALAEAQGRLVVVDVFTTWCGPCKMIAPELEKMAEELGEKAILAKLDCTTHADNKKWAMAQNVKALPTFILFKDGKRVGDMTGAKSASLRKLIDVHA